MHATHEQKEGARHGECRSQPCQAEGSAAEAGPPTANSRKEANRTPVSLTQLDGPRQFGNLIRQSRLARAHGESGKTLIHLGIQLVVEFWFTHRMPPSTGSIRRRSACRAGWWVGLWASPPIRTG